MRRMVSLLQLGVGVVLLSTVVVVPAASQQCSRVPHDDYGCQTFILASPGGARCQVATQGSPDFSFYLRPGTTFTSLQIKLTLTWGPPTTIYIGRDVLGQRNKWYHVQMTSYASLFDVTYDILIDGQKQRSQSSVSNAHTFDIYTIGSPYYASDCNPSNYPPPPPEDDTNDGTTSLSLGLHWPTTVIVGAIVDAMIDVIAIVTMVITRRRRKKEDKERAVSVRSRHQST